MADRLEFLQVVTPGQQILAAFEGLTLKVRSQAVCQHRNIQVVGDVTQLKNLVLGQKLRFIDQYAVQCFGGV